MQLNLTRGRPRRLPMSVFSSAGLVLTAMILLFGHVPAAAGPGGEAPLGRPDAGALITNRTLGHIPSDTQGIPPAPRRRPVGARSRPEVTGHRRKTGGRQTERQAERHYWQQRALAVAREEGVPAWLFLRLIRQESGFNPRARSPVGAIGLTQLMPETARHLGVNPHDPEQNLRGGARYLRQMLVRFRGHIPSALASYNAGPVAVEAYQRGESRRVGHKVINAGRRVLPLPPYRETRQYVAAILSPPSGYQPGSQPGGMLLPSLPPPMAPPVAAAPRRAGRIYIESADGRSPAGLIAATVVATGEGGKLDEQATERPQPRPARSIYIFQMNGEQP